FPTRKTGSLYYLLDGLTDSKRPEYAWSPESNDKNPWLHITLPAPASLGQLKLYSPCGNLSDGEVVVNGKSFPFHNGRKITEGRENVVIVVDLKGETSRELRISFVKFEVKANATSVTGRLLTEVELYAR
ncbi:MAG: hypothetical protein IJJ33_21340, partial [Victivallales bacterium]|nr:hypothetical protein [Victivallales bacterium]